MMTGGQLWDIMTNEVKQEAALVRWRNEKMLPQPIPASRHVALQVTRRELRAEKSPLVVLGWSLIGVAIVTGLTILVVAL
jgi:hypothetical protein